MIQTFFKVLLALMMAALAVLLVAAVIPQADATHNTPQILTQEQVDELWDKYGQYNTYPNGYIFYTPEANVILYNTLVASDWILDETVQQVVAELDALMLEEFNSVYVEDKKSIKKEQKAVKKYYR